MKKLCLAITTSSLLVGANFSQAAETAMPAVPPLARAPFGGFYAGLLLGYGSGKGAAEQTKVTTLPVTATTVTSDISVDGMNGGVVVGYGKTLGESKVYLGFDASYTFDGAKGRAKMLPSDINLNTSAREVEIRKKDSIELAARLGFAYLNTLPFIKLGWSNAKVEGKEKFTQGLGAAAQSFTLQVFNKRLNGFLVGAGIDIKLAKNIVAGFDYTFITYQSQSGTTSKDGVQPVSASDNVTSKVKLTDNKFRLKVAYQF